MRAFPPSLLVLLLAALALVLLVPPAAAGRGFGVSARGSVHTAIPKRLLREGVGSEDGGAEEEDEEPAPPSFLEEVRACVPAVLDLHQSIQSITRL